MNGSNNLNNENNSGDSNLENNENSSNPSNSDLTYLHDLSKKFARESLTGDYKGKYVSNLGLYNEFKSNTFDLEKFLSKFRSSFPSTSDNAKLLYKIDDYEESVKERIFDEFMSEVDKMGFVLDQCRGSLFNLIKTRYKVNDDISLKRKINTLKGDYIKKLLLSVDDLESYVKLNITSNTKRIDNNESIVNIFSKFSFSSYDEMIKKISSEVGKDSIDDAMVDLFSINSKIKSGENLDIIDVENLLKYGIFDNVQKRELLHLFLPLVSLKFLKENGIVSKDDVDRIKSEKLNNYGRTNKLDSIDDDEILLSIKEYTIPDDNIKKLIGNDAFLKALTDSFNKFKDNVVDELLSKVQTLSALKKELLRKRKVSNKFRYGKSTIDKMEEGNVLYLKHKDKEVNSYIEFGKFFEDGTFEGKIRTLNGSYNSNSSVKNEKILYKNLLEFIESDDVLDAEILTKEELDDNIKSGKIKEINNGLGDIDNLVISDYVKDLNKKIENISFGKTPEELEKDDEYQKLKELKGIVDDNENYAEDDTIKEELNLFNLSKKIDEIDSAGARFGIKQGVSFTLESGDKHEFHVYTITDVDKINKKIKVITSSGTVDSGSFEDFYSIFKEKSFKRFTSNANLDGLPSLIGGEEWGKMKVKDKKLVKDKEFTNEDKEKKSEDYYVCNYLVQEKKDKGKADIVLELGETTYIGSNQMIEVSFGKINDAGGKEVYEFGKKELVTIGFLENYIKLYKLKPEFLKKSGAGLESAIDSKNKKKDFIKQPKESSKLGFFNWFLSNKSIAEILQGLKIGFKEFQEHLKSGNEEHAAKVALATWGKFLPPEVKMQLVARVESAEKKHMEEYGGKLESMDSWQAVKLIHDKWLKYKNTESYKLEAGLIFMLKKYGNLYNKSPLNERKGEFLWFKALSGCRDDVTVHPIYIEVKEKCEKESRNFTEEEAVWQLIKKQCGSKRHEIGNIHRRARLHKEVEKYKKSGVMEEYEDGKKKGGETRNPVEQLNKGISEFEAGSPANGVGWLEKLIDRGTTMQNYNEIPFILVMSGNGKTYSDTLSNQIKNTIDANRPVLLARFMSYPADMDLAKDAMRILARRIQEYNPSLYPTIGDDIDKLYEMTNSTDKNEVEKLKACRKIYEKMNTKTGKTYGDIMTRAMYMLADGRHELGDDVNAVLLINKDKPGYENSILKQYYNKILGYSYSNEYKNDGYMSDSFLSIGTSSLGSNVTQTVLKLGTEGGYKMAKSGAPFAKEVVSEIVAIKNRKYALKEHQKLHLEHYLKMIFKGLILAHPTNPERVIPLFKDPGDLAVLNNKWGINYKDIVDAGLSETKIDDGEGNEIFDRFVDNILNDRKLDKNGIEKSVKDSVFTILEGGKSGSDDYYMKKAA
ncbi:MAG: hypothetical protein PHN31_03180 [Candidatus Gracilibacteria bacterium]|nr:hypothetical protein [Candidatus Gracilibacteria bacterium]